MNQQKNINKCHVSQIIRTEIQVNMEKLVLIA